MNNYEVEGELGVQSPVAYTEDGDENTWRALVRQRLAHQAMHTRWHTVKGIAEVGRTKPWETGRNTHRKAERNTRKVWGNMNDMHSITERDA